MVATVIISADVLSCFSGRAKTFTRRPTPWRRQTRRMRPIFLLMPYLFSSRPLEKHLVIKHKTPLGNKPNPTINLDGGSISPFIQKQQQCLVQRPTS